MWAEAGGSLDGRCLDAYFTLVQHATCLGASVSIRHLLISRAGGPGSLLIKPHLFDPCKVSDFSFLID